MPRRFKTPGTLTRLDFNCARLSFKTDGFQKTFDVVLIPSITELNPIQGTVFYDNADNFVGTISFNGHLGKNDC